MRRAVLYVRYGDPIELFNGKNLDGWVVLGGPRWGKLNREGSDGRAVEGWFATDPNAVSGWSVENGILINNPVQREGEPRVNYGNLHTTRTFEDFNLVVEVNVEKNGNSGIYLRGIYEVQVMDSFGQPTDSHHLGAIYGRTAPSVAAEKPAGEWQTLDITLVNAQTIMNANSGATLDIQGDIKTGDILGTTSIFGPWLERHLALYRAIAARRSKDLACT